MSIKKILLGNECEHSGRVRAEGETIVLIDLEGRFDQLRAARARVKAKEKSIRYTVVLRKRDARVIFLTLKK